MNKDNFFLDRYEKQGHKLNIEQIREEYFKKKFIRVNTLKISKKELIMRLSDRFFIKEVPEITDALEILLKNKKKFSLSSTTEYLLGYFYMQDLFSMIPATFFDYSKFVDSECCGDKFFLDATAAPGSKTTQIAQYMKNKGTIIAIDNKSHRLKKLNNNLERLGVRNTITILSDINDELLIKEYNEKFNAILLDAPCSGNFVTDSEWFDKRDFNGIKYNSEKQKKIIDSCLKMLKYNGEFVYSTCSLEPEEDEEIVEYILNKYKEILEPIELKKIFGAEKIFKNALKFWPDKTEGQGFFVAKFRKK